MIVRVSTLTLPDRDKDIAKPPTAKVCAEQDETGEADAMFVLESGATLSNVIIGPNQAEGVHCKGTW